jgi:hypothetical protein
MISSTSACLCVLASLCSKQLDRACSIPAMIHDSKFLSGTLRRDNKWSHVRSVITNTALNELNWCQGERTSVKRAAKRRNALLVRALSNTKGTAFSSKPLTSMDGGWKQFGDTDRSNTGQVCRVFPRNLIASQSFMLRSHRFTLLFKFKASTQLESECLWVEQRCLNYPQ